jgi:hypothetical protein
MVPKSGINRISVHHQLDTLRVLDDMTINPQ